MSNKITNEIIDARLIGRDVKRIGNYTKSKDKIEFKRDKFLKIDGKRVFIDFYLTSGVFVERHGEHHYFPVRYGGISLKEATNKFYKQISRDILLQKYCVENNIKLIEIPYYVNEDEIPAIIYEGLKSV